jgi:hypothetical protein
LVQYCGSNWLAPDVAVQWRSKMCWKPAGVTTHCASTPTWASPTFDPTFWQPLKTAIERAQRMASWLVFFMVFFLSEI